MHSTKSEFRFCAASNSACVVLEAFNDENLLMVGCGSSWKYGSTHFCNALFFYRNRFLRNSFTVFSDFVQV